MSDHYHYDYASTHHDHRGQYADDRHDHGLDYAEKHHRHYDDESAVRGLREDLAAAEERVRELEGDLRGALECIRVLERLRPTCVICRDATADRQTVRGPACTDCVGDLPEHFDAETWAFPEEGGGLPEDLMLWNPQAKAEAEAEAWGGRAPSASYEEWLAEGQGPAGKDQP